MPNLIYATGGTGPLNIYIGWFNFGATNVNVGTTLNFTNSIPNVGNISWSIYNSSTSGSAGVVASSIAPFATGYSGQSGNSVIRFQGTTAISTLTFNNIALTDFSGNPLNKKYSIVAADGELTGGIEFNQWVTNGSNWDNLVTIPTTAAPAANISGVGTSILRNTGNLTGNTYITPVAVSQYATQIIYTAKPNSGEGTALGVLVDQILTSKSVSSTSTNVGAILTYTIPITNISIDTLNSINIIDTLPSSVSYLAGSFVVNGVSQPDPTFPNLNIADISLGATSTVVFKVTVTGTQPNPILNSAYVYGNQGTYPNNATTNTVVTTINYATLNAIKSVDKTTAVAGNILTYTIALYNSGTTTATNVILTDTIPTTTTFVTGSVTGATGTPPTLTVGTIAPGRTSTVSFKVTIGTLPNNPILNNSTANFFYYANGGTTGTTVPSSAISNQVSTSTASASITSITKSASENYGTIGDIITYTFNFANTGNDTALGLTLIDTIPNGTTFVADSVYVNGVQQLGQNPAPTSGAILPNLSSQTSNVVTFQVQVTTIPSPNPIKNQAVLKYSYAANTIPTSILSNQAVTTINYSTLSSTKQVNTAYGNIGDILTYTIAITNIGNTTANNILFIDTIPNGTSLLTSSFKQDGVLLSGSPNPPGQTLSSPIKAGATSTITFQVTINTIPTPNPVLNIASASGSFTINGVSVPNTVGINATNSNSVSTQINNASLGGITKSVDKIYATCGDIITYTMSIPNAGNVTAQNIILKDTIPNNTVLITNSVYINGIQQIGYNPSIGVTIPNIAPLSTATLSFQVQIQC